MPSRAVRDLGPHAVRPEPVDLVDPVSGAAPHRCYLCRIAILNGKQDRHFNQHATTVASAPRLKAKHSDRRRDRELNQVHRARVLEDAMGRAARTWQLRRCI